MKIKYVEISNILSIDQIRLEFADSGLVLLDGWNFDDDTANGAGKTAIFNSIAYGIFGKFPRKISASDILRSNTKSGYVKVGIDINGSLYEVHRARPNHLKFSIDGLDKDITQEEFESNIRMTYTQYLISMYSAQTEGLKLISMNDTGKKDFFLQLLNLDVFDECKHEVSSRIDILNKTKTKLDNDMSILETKIVTDREHMVDISELEQPSEQELNHIRQQIEEKSTIGKPDISKFDMLEQKIYQELTNLNARENEMQYKRSNLLVLQKEYDELSRVVYEYNVECPHCNQTFSLDSKDPKTLKHLEEQRQRKLSEIQFKIAFNNIATDIDFAAEKAKFMDMLSKCKSKRDKVLEEYSEAIFTINKLKNEEAKLDKLKARVVGIQKRNIEIESKIVNNLAIVEQLGDKLDGVLNEIVLYESVLALFSPTGAPAYVLDSAVDVFNDKVFQYASMIWPNANYTLQSFKENKSGDIKAKFSERLVINGKERSIGALSGGEHRCLSLAIDFAVIDVLEIMFGISMNPIMLDEAFNDLDASNRDRVLELLEKISVDRQIWVIDHATEAKAAFSNIVRVEKRNGISSLVI